MKRLLLAAMLISASLFGSQDTIAERKAHLEQLDKEAFVKAKELFKEFGSMKTWIDTTRKDFDKQYEAIAAEITECIAKQEREDPFYQNKIKKIKKRIKDEYDITVIPTAFHNRQDLFDPFSLSHKTMTEFIKEDLVMPSLSNPLINISKEEAIAFVFGGHTSCIPEHLLPIIESFWQDETLKDIVILSCNYHFLCQGFSYTHSQGSGVITLDLDKKPDTEGIYGILLHERGHIELGTTPSFYFFLLLLRANNILNEENYYHLSRIIENNCDAFAYTYNFKGAQSLGKFIAKVYLKLGNQKQPTTHPQSSERYFNAKVAEYMWILSGKTQSKL